MRHQFRRLPGGALNAFLLTAAFAGVGLACDDPPRHYPEPCKTGSSGSPAYLAVAREKGFFDRNQVRLEIVRVGGTDVIAQLEVGNLQVAQVTAAQVILAYLKGFRSKIFATPLTTRSVDLWTRAPSVSVGDLRGRTIGVGAPGSGDLLAIESVGLRPADVKYAIEPSLEARSLGLSQGTYDAGLFPPFWETRLRERGLTKLRTITNPFAPDVLVAGAKMFQDERDKRYLVGFLRSVEDAFRYLRENKQDSVDIIAKFGTGFSRSEAEIIYQTYSQAPIRPEVSAQSVQAVVENLKREFPQEADRLGRIKLDEIITQDIVRLTR